MNKLIPFKKFSPKNHLSGAKIVIDEKNIPLQFIFGRDSFISFLEYIDSEFEKNVSDPEKAYNNPAGKLIDLIEERLPLRAEFIKDLKTSIEGSKKTKSIPLDDVIRSLNV